MLWQQVFTPKATFSDEEIIFSKHFRTGIFVIHHGTSQDGKYSTIRKLRLAEKGIHYR